MFVIFFFKFAWQLSSLQHEFQPSSTGPHPSSLSSDLKATWAWKETEKDQSTHVVITRPTANLVSRSYSTTFGAVTSLITTADLVASVPQNPESTLTTFDVSKHRIDTQIIHQHNETSPRKQPRKTSAQLQSHSHSRKSITGKIHRVGVSDYFPLLHYIHCADLIHFQIATKCLFFQYNGYFPFKHLPYVGNSWIEGPNFYWKAD